MVLLRARRVDQELGTLLRVEVDPAQLAEAVDSELPLVKRARRRVRHAPDRVASAVLSAMGSAHPFALGDRAYPDTEPIEETWWYSDLADLVTRRDAPERSRWYRRQVERFGEQGPFDLKGSSIGTVADIDRHLECHLLPLIRSIERDGYRPDLADDTGAALVGSDGALHKAKGAKHRFAIARLLGVDRFPLRITCVHRQWLRERVDTTMHRRAIAQIPVALREVEADHAPPLAA